MESTALIPLQYALDTFFLLVCGALVMWMAIGVRPWRTLQPRHDLSYGLYLWHFPVIQACVAMGLFANTAWLGLTAALFATVLLAWASWHLIEAPALCRR